MKFAGRRFISVSSCLVRSRPVFRVRTARRRDSPYSRIAIAETKRNSTCIALRRILFDRSLLVLSNYALASCTRVGASVTNGDNTARDFFRNAVFSPKSAFLQSPFASAKLITGYLQTQFVSLITSH